MDELIQRLKEEELFAKGSAVGGKKGGKGEEEEFEEDLDLEMVTRTDVNFALYGLGMQEIEGGDYEDAAEAGLIEERRRRQERKEQARRKVEDQRKEVVEVAEVQVSSSFSSFTSSATSLCPLSDS